MNLKRAGASGILSVTAALALCVASVMPANAATPGTEGEMPTKTVGIPSAQELAKTGKDDPLLGFDTRNGEMTVDAKWADKNKIGARTIIAVGRSDRYPDGMFRWVEKTTKDGDVYVLKTRTARLNETLAGIPQEEINKVAGKELTGQSEGVEGTVADIKTAKDVAAANAGIKITKDGARGADATISAVGALNPITTNSGIHVNKQFGKEIHFEFNRKIDAKSCQDNTFKYGQSAKHDPNMCSWEGPGQLRAHLSLKVGANGALVIESHGLKLQEASATGSAEITGETKLETEGKIHGHMTWVLADLKYPITIPVGSVPITINVNVKPTVSLMIDSDGNSSATLGGLHASVNRIGFQASTLGGVANDGRGGVELLKGKPEFKVDKPDLMGKSNLITQVSVDPNTTVDLMGIIGVTGNIGATGHTAFHIAKDQPICLLGLGMHGYTALAELHLSKIPAVGWFLGGFENQINKLAKKVRYEFDMPSLYTSPNLCATSPISIGDKVWIDKNHNGIQDEGEPGLAGAQVTLLRGINKNVINEPASDAFKRTVISSQTTKEDGAYKFTDDPLYKGYPFGKNKGKNKGKLMPGYYTVVVTPPNASGGDAYAKHREQAPWGYVPTTRFVRSGSMRQDGLARTIDDLSRDSGGKYAWEANSYGGFFDGTRYQDQAPKSFLGYSDNINKNKLDLKQLLDYWTAELRTTKGYNNTVDFGFIPASEADVPKFRMSGKVYVAKKGVYEPGFHVGNLPWAAAPRWVKGAQIVLTPLEGTMGKERVLETDLAGRWSDRIPAGNYRITVKQLPDGYVMPQDSSKSFEIVVNEQTASSNLIPNSKWPNLGVVAK
ncbi:MAG: SdrD B-like domain-containing protein [Actinomycetaceae bacterium]|nr:SdrD B-like domain-containing protein [Actinomycetaceae bacterium]